MASQPKICADDIANAAQQYGKGNALRLTRRYILRRVSSKGGGSEILATERGLLFD